MLWEIIDLNYDFYYGMNSHFTCTRSYWRGKFGWELPFKCSAVIDGFLLSSHACAMCRYQFLLPSFSNFWFIPCHPSPQQRWVLWRLVPSRAGCPAPTLGFTAWTWELMSHARCLGCPTLPAQTHHHHHPLPHAALTYQLPVQLRAFPTVPTWTSLWEWGWVSSHSRFRFRNLHPLNTWV